MYEEEEEETEGALCSRRQQDFIVENDKALVATRLLIIALHVCVKMSTRTVVFMKVKVMEKDSKELFLGTTTVGTFPSPRFLLRSSLNY